MDDNKNNEAEFQCYTKDLYQGTSCTGDTKGSIGRNYHTLSCYKFEVRILNQAQEKSANDNKYQIIYLQNGWLM